MMITGSIFLYMLLASNIAVLAIACVLLTRLELRWKRIGESWDSSNDVESKAIEQTEHWERLEATKKLERRLTELRQAVKVIQIQAPAQSPQTERKLPLENAVRMARHGASVDDLTRNCGLSIGEARLMQKLHKSNPATVNGR